MFWNIACVTFYSSYNFQPPCDLSHGILKILMYIFSTVHRIGLPLPVPTERDNGHLARVKLQTISRSELLLTANFTPPIKCMYGSQGCRTAPIPKCALFGRPKSASIAEESENATNEATFKQNKKKNYFKLNNSSWHMHWNCMIKFYNIV